MSIAAFFNPLMNVLYDMPSSRTAALIRAIHSTRNSRLFLVVRLVKMWRLPACERLTEPLPRTRKRFLAPDFVFIFGISNSLFAAHGGALTRLRRRGRGFVALRLTGLGLVRVMRF